MDKPWVFERDAPLAFRYPDCKGDGTCPRADRPHADCGYGEAAEKCPSCGYCGCHDCGYGACDYD